MHDSGKISASFPNLRAKYEYPPSHPWLYTEQDKIC
jgi:hypothetical protein